MASSESDVKHLPPPFIYLPSLANLRDAGGLPVRSPDGSTEQHLVVRKGVLYRSADPTFCLEEEIRFLREELGITMIYDLRSQPEFEKQDNAVQEWDDRIEGYNRSNANKIYREWTPVFKTQDYSPESIAIRFRDYGAADGAQGFVRAYSEILKHGGPSYSKILKHLASQDPTQPTGVLLHCSAGKDRTGVLVALILSILGVPVDEICQEYQLTETGLAERRKFFIERILSTGAFDGAEGLEAATRMTGARAESMKATLEMIDEVYGSPEGYVRKICGLNDDDINRLRRSLVVGANGAGNNVGTEKRAML
ncbi:hypothetical protein EJ08DRAFT_648796 [Tothia fuscella]|uniref:Tyrosine specific protein phosphatases domain-containing protein n=1 Tax=Tothia fuscella TaxID=1048955 RepID=A0A9P4NSU1_9PEZI|nr:hypothetical protein EJ08DRAFT_648796 [Tothia fuscella]